MNILLDNKAFIKNILTGILEIRLVQVNIGEVLVLLEQELENTKE